MTLWTPANLATAAKCWLRADTLGLSGGASVSPTWPDSSGNAADAVPVVTAPTFQTNQLNSLPVVRFAASGPQCMAAQPVVTTVYTVFALAHNNGAAQQRIISGDSGSAANWLLGWWNTKQEVYFFGALGNLTGTAVTTNWLMYEATSDHTTTIIYRDGTQIYSDGTALSGLGSFLVLAGASPGGASENSDCEVAEVLVTNYVMSTTDRQLVEGYMAWKWGRQASLPGGHPYAGAAPTLFSPGNSHSVRRVWAGR